MDWTRLGEDAEAKLKMDLEQPAALMALISVLKDKGILVEDDMELFNERHKIVQNLMFETAKAVGMVMMLQEELGEEERAPQVIAELEKVVKHVEVLMEMCGHTGMVAELHSALEQARAGLDVMRCRE